MRAEYGRTWWGRAWIEATIGPAPPDSYRLVRGQAYVRDGLVRRLSIAPGAIGAFVQGSQPAPYPVIINTSVLDDAAWTAIFDEIATSIGNVAALLDGELPPAIATGTSLLPRPDELHIACSCLGRPVPCAHATAVYYLIADTFDADPFALLLLRGRTRDEVFAALHDRRPPAGPALTAMLAREAFRRQVAELPAAVLPPHRPGLPTALPAPPAAAGVTAEELAALVTSAAHRAWELLRN